MKLYIHSSIMGLGGVHADNRDIVVEGLTSSLSDIAGLWHLKYLPSDATVWINGDHPHLGMWVLSDDSSHVRVRRSVEAGWARINRSSVRFARSAEATVNRPLATYSLDEIDIGVSDPNMTIVVSHSQSEKRLQLVANSKIAYPVNGTVRFDPFTVVDLNHYDPPEKSTTNPVLAADAMVNGVKLMTYGAEPDRVQMVKDNIEAFAFDVDDKLSERIHGANQKTMQTAQHIIVQIAQKLGSALTPDGDTPPSEGQ